MQSLKNVIKTSVFTLIATVAFSSVSQADIPLFTYKNKSCVDDTKVSAKLANVDVGTAKTIEVQKNGKTITVPAADIVRRVQDQLQSWVNALVASQDPFFLSRSRKLVCIGTYKEAAGKENSMLVASGLTPSGQIVKNHHLILGEGLLAKIYEAVDKGYFAEDVAIAAIAGHEFSHSLQMRWRVFHDHFKVEPSTLSEANKGLSQDEIKAATAKAAHDSMKALELHADCMNGYFLQLHELSDSNNGYDQELLSETVSDLEGLFGANRYTSPQERLAATEQGIQAAKSDLSGNFTKQTRNTVQAANIINACSSYYYN